MGVGLGAVVLGGWVFAALYVSADDDAEVLVVDEGVDRFEVIERSDLRVSRVSTDAGVSAVSADRLDEVVGRVAATDLVVGGLLSEAQLVADGERLVEPGEAVVGVQVGAGDGPVGVLRQGAEVLVVMRPAQGASGDPVDVSGWVLSTSSESGDGELSVEVVVDRRDAAEVSAAAADGRVTIVVLGEG